MARLVRSGDPKKRDGRVREEEVCGRGLCVDSGKRLCVSVSFLNSETAPGPPGPVRPQWF